MIPFSPPYIDDDIINEVVDSLKSGWITTGPKVRALEEELSSYLNAPEVLCVNSWTSGAILMFHWLGLQPEDEVIIPCYTYSATALSVIRAGAKPVIVDVNENFNIDVEKIRAAITPKTKVIMPVDFAGLPCDYDAIKALIEEPEIKRLFSANSPIQEQLGRIALVSDAAHSLGASFGLERIGNCDFTIYSLHAVKNVTTAEGGAIAIHAPKPFNHQEVYKTLRLMTLNCQTKDALSKSKGGSWKYDIIGLGLKINLPDINAAIGLAQMKKYPQLLERRKWLFNLYKEQFEDYSGVKLPVSKLNERTSSCHLYPIRIKDCSEEERDEIIKKITEKQVSVNVHFIPLPLLSYFKGLGYDIKDYPVAYQNYKSEISLPIYPQMTDYNIIQIAEAVKASIEEVLN